MNNESRRFKLTFTSIITIVFVAVLTAQLSSMVLLNGNVDTVVYAKYSNSQAQSLVNDCGVGGSTGINCANNGHQTLGENNVINTPINSQISNPAKEGSPGPPGPRGEQGPPGPTTEPLTASRASTLPLHHRITHVQ